MGGARKDGPSRPLTSEDDLDLWRGIARTARPLRKRNEHADAKRPAGDKPQRAAAEEPAPERPRVLPRRRAPEVRPPPPLAAGAGADVDRRTADRLKRGKLPIEGRLDLHGMTQEEARAAVSGFIAAGVAAGRRCVLVITGKGSGRDGGVLRQGLPGWLNEPANRTRLIAFAPAQPQHGGHGAMYLLLKRPRDRP